MRLIDADELKKEVQRLIDNAPTIDICQDCDCRRAAIEALKAEPVKHGRWIEGELYIKCSECGYPAGHLSDNYCPNCGCAMTKEKEK